MELLRSAELLSKLTKIPLGKELSHRLFEVANLFVYSLDNPTIKTTLRELAFQNSSFQHQRLKEEEAELKNQAKQLIIFVVVVSGLTFLSVGYFIVSLGKKINYYGEISQFVVSATPNAVIVGDNKGRVVLVNPAFANLVGNSFEIFPGLPLEIVGPTGKLLASYMEKKRK